MLLNQMLKLIWTLIDYHNFAIKTYLFDQQNWDGVSGCIWASEVPLCVSVGPMIESFIIELFKYHLYENTKYSALWRHQHVNTRIMLLFPALSWSAYHVLVNFKCIYDITCWLKYVSHQPYKITRAFHVLVHFVTPYDVTFYPHPNIQSTQFFIMLSIIMCPFIF